MTIYWFMFFVPAIMTLVFKGQQRNFLLYLGFILTLIIGLRFEVGADWSRYLWQLEHHGQQTLAEILQVGREPGFRLLNWISYRAGLDVWLTNLVCAFLFTAGLVSFVRKLPLPYLALAVCIPYLVIVVGMGYTRQAAAIGLIFLGMNHYFRGRMIWFLGYLMLAMMFHRSSIALMALAMVPYIQKRPVAAILLFPLAYVIYLSIIAEKQEAFVYIYVESSYSDASAGGLVRLILNGCFALTFLYLRRRFALEPFAAWFWIWMSVASIILIPVGIFFPVAADRLGIFFLMLQPFVSSHLPGFVSGSQAIFVQLLVLAFFALVMAVWLLMADHRYGWIPYKFWLFT